MAMLRKFMRMGMIPRRLFGWTLLYLVAQFGWAHAVRAQEATGTITWADAAVCFYEHADYRGRRYCIQPGTLRAGFPEWMDRKTSSIRVPDGLSVRVWDDLWGRGRAATFMGGVSINQLLREGMQDAIRSAQVARTHAACAGGCVIAPEEAYDLGAIFGPSSADDGTVQASVAFEMRPGQDFTVEHGRNLRFRFIGDKVTVSDSGSSKPLLSLTLLPATRYALVAFDSDGRESLSAQLVQADASRRYLAATPPLVAPLAETKVDVLAIANYRLGNFDRNDPNALRLAGASFARARQGGRVTRGVRCHNGPALINVVEYFLGTCAVPAIHRLTPVAGDGPRNVPATPAGGGDKPNTAVMSHVYAGEYNPMAVYAAARICHMPVESVVHPRMRRGLDGTGSCVYRTMAIIAAYQTVFGPRWTDDEFVEVIRNIVSYGTTGYASSNPEAEDELIRVVLQRRSNVTGQAFYAFHAANALLGVSYYGTPNLEDVAARPPATGGGAVPFPTAVAAREADLGAYRLDMANYRPREVRPRLWTNGGWIESTDGFTREIIPATDHGRLAPAVAALNEWQSAYHAAALQIENVALVAAFGSGADTRYGVRERQERFRQAQDRLTPAQRGELKLAEIGESMAVSLWNEMEDAGGDSAVYVVVRFRGAVMAVLGGFIDSRGIGHIDTVVSASRNVLQPYRDGAVRGSGGYAMHGFLQYLGQQGVTEVETDAVTTPSAYLKQSAGFMRYFPEDDDSDSDSSGSDSHGGELRRR